jgi:uncharacterized protein (TIGR03067 family)
MPDDLAILQGVWTLQSIELDGQAMPPAGGIEIRGNRFRSIGMGAEYSGTVELDEAAKPKRFDLIFSAGPEAGNRNRGIYSLAGDTWKLCLNMTGKSRPRAFAARPGSGNALEVFIRGAVAALSASSTSHGTATARQRTTVHESPPDPALIGEWDMLSAAQSGHSLDAAMVKTGWRATTAAHTTTYFGNQVFRSADYTADPTQTPKTIDLHSKGKTELGIYEVVGDTMRVCFAAPGMPRPTDYETHPGDGRTFAAWKRR